MKLNQSLNNKSVIVKKINAAGSSDFIATMPLSGDYTSVITFFFPFKI